MEKTGSILKRYGIKPVKSLGQNFLADDRVTRRIVEEAGVNENDCVFEVGAGIGSLTARLAEKARRVIAVETDRRLIPALEDVLKSFANTVIINDDVMGMDIVKTVGAHRGDAPGLKVVANLPYYITTPIIMKILDENPGIESMTIMVQKEVADRLTAPPGTKDYGALTVAVGFYTEPERVMNVSPGSFIPRPEVYSSVVKLKLRDKPPVGPEVKEVFFNMVRAAFGQRRKTLINALFNSGNFNMSREEIKQRLIDAGVDPDCRGETLSVMQFAELSISFSTKII